MSCLKKKNSSNFSTLRDYISHVINYFNDSNIFEIFVKNPKKTAANEFHMVRFFCLTSLTGIQAYDDFYFIFKEQNLVR
jgi:hypothetical protein